MAQLPPPIPLGTIAERVAAFDAGHTVQCANEIGLRSWMTASAETVRTLDSPVVLWRVKPHEREDDGGFYGRAAAREGRQAVILSKGLEELARAPSSATAESLREIARGALEDAAAARQHSVARDVPAVAGEPERQAGASRKANGREIWRGHDGELVGMRRTSHIPNIELAEIVDSIRRSVCFVCRREAGGISEAPRAGTPVGSDAEIAVAVLELLRRHDLLPYPVDQAPAEEH